MQGTYSTTRTGLCYRVARLYNSLPLQLRSCQAVTKSTTKAKNFLKNETAYKQWLSKNVKSRWYSSYESVVEAIECEDDPLSNGSLSEHMDRLRQYNHQKIIQRFF